MRRYETLRKAPITEALIDLRVELPSKTDFKKIEAITEKVSKTYPKVKTRNLFQAEIRLEGGPSPQSKATNIQDGLVFISESKQRVMQAALTGFTFSWLEPYKDWETLSRESKKLWRVYVAAVEPSKIQRIATRFINRLALPADLRDFKDFLTAAPEVPPRLPQNLISFFSRNVIPTREDGVMAIITQAIQKPKPDEQNTLPVLLDIEVFWEGNLDREEPVIWEMLDTMRHIKNEIFFESITDRLEATYR